MRLVMLVLQAMLLLLAIIVLFVFFVDARFETVGFFIFGVGLSLLLVWVLNKVKNRWPLNSYLSRFLLCLSFLFCFAGLHEFIGYLFYNKEGVVYFLVLIFVSVILFLMGVDKENKR